MSRIITHYDNLKVVRDAPIEVIRAAYRSLSQKYHPDRNPGNPQAARIMAILNAAYDTLSDTLKRQRHDEWIVAEEKRLSQQYRPQANNQQKPAEKTSKSENVTQRKASGFNQYGHKTYSSPSEAYDEIIRQRPHNKQSDTPHSCPNKPVTHRVSATRPIVIGIAIPLGLWFIYYIFGSSPSTNHIAYPTGTSSSQYVVPDNGPTEAYRPALSPNASAITNRLLGGIPLNGSSTIHSGYQKPNTAPNGNPWPRTSGYVKGYPRQNTDGLSSVTIDNSKNDSDIFAKLVHLDRSNHPAIRQFFITAYGSFTVEKVRAGHYDVRYRDLENGHLARTDSFSLEETKILDGDRSGTKFSQITMTLYKVINGNMQTHAIREDEF